MQDRLSYTRASARLPLPTVFERDGDNLVWITQRDDRFRSVGTVPIAGPFQSTREAWKWLERRRATEDLQGEDHDTR